MKAIALGFAFSLLALELVSGQPPRNDASTSRKVSIHPGSDAHRLEPDPSLSPEQVVRTQLEALQRNDSPEKDSGIRIAYSFSSPANRANIGSIEHFAEIVHNPIYQPMINHRMTRLDAIKVEGELAVQRVTLWDQEGRRVVYLFTLTRQSSGEYGGCWMTDGVMRVANEPRALA